MQCIMGKVVIFHDFWRVSSFRFSQSFLGKFNKFLDSLESSFPKDSENVPTFLNCSTQSGVMALQTLKT